MKIPERDASRRWDHRRPSPNQRRYFRQRGLDLVRLERNENVVLWSKLFRPIRCAHVNIERRVRPDNAKPVLLDRGKLWTATDHADFKTGHAREMSAKIATDRAGPENADPHSGLSCSSAERLPGADHFG